MIWKRVRRYGLRVAGVVFVVLLILPFLGVDINPSLWGPLSLMEALGLFINSAGVYFSAHNFKLSNEELLWTIAQPIPDPLEVVVAAAGKRIDGAILGIQSVFLFIVFIYAWTPPSQNAQVHTVGAISVLLGFVGVSLLLTYLGYEADEDRARFRAIVARRKRIRPVPLSGAGTESPTERVRGPH